MEQIKQKSIEELASLCGRRFRFKKGGTDVIGYFVSDPIEIEGGHVVYDAHILTAVDGFIETELAEIAIDDYSDIGYEVLLEL